jgi:hypothetical protein
MDHLLKIKCVRLWMNVNISALGPWDHDSANAKFSINMHETDYGARVYEAFHIEPLN